MQQTQHSRFLGPAMETHHVKTVPVMEAGRVIPLPPGLLVCIDGDDDAARILPNARAVARGLGLQTTLARVAEPELAADKPTDPVEWRRNLRALQKNLRKIIGQKRTGPVANDHRANTRSVLLTGSPAEELADWAEGHGVTMLAVGRGRSRSGRGFGPVPRGLLDNAEHSLLFVPATSVPQQSYRKIMVPIDGSYRAQSVLPVARRIARTNRAELLLVQVLPSQRTESATINGPKDVLERQLPSARRRLDELSSCCIDEGVTVRTIVDGPGDPGIILEQIAKWEHVDLIVMSSHGETGSDEVPCGSVTEHLAGHSDVPVLMVRPNIVCSFDTIGDPETTSVFRFS